jgi:hypothetical protein
MAEQIPGGRAKGKTPSDFDPKELAMGVKVEQEHTKDKAMALEIAMDHLAEISDYYTRLLKMEDAAKKTAAVPKKYDHIDFKPPQSVADAAAKGLEYRQKASPSNRGGLTPAEASKQGIGSGVQRATNLKNRDNISPEVIQQIHNFLSRSEGAKAIDPKHKSEPWNDKGYVAWLLWGGDPAKAWVNKILNQMEAADKAAKKARIAADLTPDYNNALGRFGLAVRNYLDEVVEPLEKEQSVSAFMQQTWAMRVHQAGRAVMPLLVAVKVVPPAQRRAFEKAYREFTRTRRMDYAAWAAKNIESINLLASTRKWPDIADAVPDEDAPNAVSNVGDVKVINQSSQDPKQTVELVRRAIQLMQNSSVPSISRALYGEVFITGEIARKKNMMAFYDINRDMVFVLAVKRFADKQLHSLIHEFGHRYWRKFMSKSAKEAWLAHHGVMASHSVQVEDPKIGEPLPYVKGSPIVERIEHGNFYVQGGYISRMSWWEAARQNLRAGRFPSNYAASDPEEHFCEALGYFCMGELDGDNLKAFRHIVLGESGAAEATATLVASWGSTIRR